MHFDHAGNLDRFGRARFHVQEAEVQFATGRTMCGPHLRDAFSVDDVKKLIDLIYEDRVRFHHGDTVAFPGISLHLLPGHSMGLQGVRVMTPRGAVLLASDATHFYANYLLQRPARITVDGVATLRSYERLLEIVGTHDRIVPGHDPKIRRLYPTLNIGGVDIALLHETPKPHDLAELRRLDDY